MTTLAARKQVLIAESELNRARLMEDATEFSAGLSSATTRVLSIGSIVSSAVVLVASLVAFRPSRKRAAADREPSRLQTILNGIGLLSSVWLAFRSPGRSSAEGTAKPEETQPCPPR